MSRTKIRIPVFRDPLMRKGHAHPLKEKGPDLDEELDFYEDEQVTAVWGTLEEEEDYGEDETNS